jgi:hypothetical protein
MEEVNVMRLDRKASVVPAVRLHDTLAHDWAFPVVNGQKPRVLLEEPDDCDNFAYWCVLTEAGFNVDCCSGPRRQPGGRCPLLRSGHCELVDRADVIVSTLGIDDEVSRQVIEAVQRQHTETPMIIEASREQFKRRSNLFHGHRLLPVPVTRRELLDSVHAALAARRDRVVDIGSYPAFGDEDQL